MQCGYAVALVVLISVSFLILPDVLFRFDKTRGNGLKPYQGMFNLDIWKNYITEQAARVWEVVESYPWRCPRNSVLWAGWQGGHWAQAGLDDPGLFQLKWFQDSMITAVALSYFWHMCHNPDVSAWRTDCEFTAVVVIHWADWPHFLNSLLLRRNSLPVCAFTSE